MAYHDTQCPCGGKKPTDTMLCLHCETHLADRCETRVMRDATYSWTARRNAAITLLSLARRRSLSKTSPTHLS